MKTTSSSGESIYPWLGQFPQLREWVGDRQIKSIKAFGWSIKNRLFESTIAIPRTVIEDDRYGLFGSLVARGFRALGDHAAVFGPATDGGYWAVGLRRRPRFLAPFDHVRWSTEHALADSLANLTGSSVALLDMLEDVDDAESFIRQCRQGLLDTLFVRR